MIEIITNKYFILATLILIILKIVEYVVFKFTNHNWSRLGFKENNYTYIVYLFYLIIYCSVITINCLDKFIEWFETI